MNIFLRELLNQKKYREINEFLRNGLIKEDLLLKELTAKEIVELTNKLGISVDKAADIIIETGNTSNIYYFAKNIEGAPIEKLAKAVIEIKHAKYIYAFAKYVEGAPIDKLANGVIKTKDAYYIYFFARDVEGAPIDKLADGIIATKVAGCIYEFARDVEGAPIDKLADVIIKLGDAEYIYKFNDLAYKFSEENKVEEFKLLIVTLFKNNRTDLIKDIISKIKNRKYLKIIRSLGLKSKEIEGICLFNELMKLSAQNNYKEILRRKDEFAQIFSDTENMEEQNHTR